MLDAGSSASSTWILARPRVRLRYFDDNLVWSRERRELAETDFEGPRRREC